MTSVSYGDRWIHADAYAGYPTGCAVELRNLEILEKEGLVENAAKRGAASGRDNHLVEPQGGSEKCAGKG